MASLPIDSLVSLALVQEQDSGIRARTLTVFLGTATQGALTVFTGKLVKNFEKMEQAKSALEKLEQHGRDGTLPKSIANRLKEWNPIKDEPAMRAITLKHRELAQKEYLAAAIEMRKDSIQSLTAEKLEVQKDAGMAMEEIVTTTMEFQINTSTYRDLFNNVLAAKVFDACANLRWREKQKRKDNMKKLDEKKLDDDEIMKPELNEATIQAMIKKQVNQALKVTKKREDSSKKHKNKKKSESNSKKPNNSRKKPSDSKKKVSFKKKNTGKKKPSIKTKKTPKN